MPASARAFKDELATGLIDSVTARPGIAVIAVVGDGMVGTPGISARVFGALATGGINVVAIAQGSSERNISLAVAEADAPEAARRIHAAFQFSKIGGGRPVSSPPAPTSCCSDSAASDARSRTRSRAANGAARVRVVGLLDRSGYVFEPRGLSRRRLLSSRARRIAARCSPRSAAGGRRPPRR